MVTGKVQTKPAGQGVVFMFGVSNDSVWPPAPSLLLSCYIIVTTLNSLSLHFRAGQEVLAILRYQGEIRHYPPVITLAIKFGSRQTEVITVRILSQGWLDISRLTSQPSPASYNLIFLL